MFISSVMSLLINLCLERNQVLTEKPVTGSQVKVMRGHSRPIKRAVFQAL